MGSSYSHEEMAAIQAKCNIEMRALQQKQQNIIQRSAAIRQRNKKHPIKITIWERSEPAPEFNSGISIKYNRNNSGYGSLTSYH